MTFFFRWSKFSEQFHADAIKMLDSALNKGTKPPVIADKIEVVELEMGTQVCLVATLVPHPLTRMAPSHQSWRFEMSESSRWTNSVVSSG